MGKFNFEFSADYLGATGIVSLLSVLVLVGLFFYLNRYTGRGYFRIWTIGWLLYACWLLLGLRAESPVEAPMAVMLKHWCVGGAAALLFWGSTQFLKLPARPTLFCLFIGFLMVWSYVGAFHLTDALQARVPIFGTIGLASLVTAFSFYRLRKHREFIGAGLLCFGFALWGAYLMISPFFAATNQMIGTGMLIATVLQLFIAVSMIVLVLEEARAATEAMLNRLRSCEFDAPQNGARNRVGDGQYPELFEQPAMEEKLRAVYRDLRQAQEKNLQQERLQALSQMSRGIAHDINNALTPILGYSNVLLAERDLPEHVHKYVQKIKKAGDKISQSVCCIRDFYRQEQGKGPLAEIELNGLLRDMIESHRPQWAEVPRPNGGRVTLQSELDSGELGVLGEKGELREALTQLVGNSLAAMPDGGSLKLRTNLRRGFTPYPGDTPGDTAVMEVSDTGIGMDEDTRKRCLEPFFSTKGGQGAKGLGLSRVFGIMQRHGGQIEIESQAGLGTTVRLVFPLLPSAAATLPASSAETVLPPLRILCVDDEPSVLDVMRLTFENAGHKVIVEGTGYQAVDTFRAAAAARKPFDVVVTDLAMPEMDGRQLAAIIKRDSPETPIMMVTGWGDIMKVEGNHPENIDAMISKPPDAKEVFAALRKLKSALLVPAHGN